MNGYTVLTNMDRTRPVIPCPPFVALCCASFLSGASALCFETLLFRLIGLSVGNGIAAASIVLSSFMTGLAAGNALAAAASVRVRNPRAIYSWIELGIALSGIALVLSLPALPGILAYLLRPLSGRPVVLDAARWLIAFAILLGPATAMGATLPFLVESAGGPERGFGRTLGAFYGWNTLGAVAGTLACETLFLRAWGVPGTGIAAALLNVLAAISVNATGAGRSVSSSSPAPSGFPKRSITPLAATLVCGFLLMGLEVVWLRILVLFSFGSSLNFSVMLAVVLAGIGAGGLIASAWLARNPEAEGIVAPLMFATGALVTVGYHLIDAAARSGRDLGDVRFALATTIVLAFPACVGSGALFTVLGACLQDRMKGQGKCTGLLTLANTAGGGLGPPTAAWLLLPAFGAERTVLAASAAYGIAGAAWLLLRGNPPSGRFPRRSITAFFALSFFASVLAFPFGTMDSLLDLSAGNFLQGNGETRIAAIETPAGTIQYLRKDILERPWYYRMVTDSYSMSSTGKWARRYMKLFAHLPLALKPDARNALLICFGCGNTAQALVDTPGIARIDVVDISEDVLRSSRLIRTKSGKSPLDDPRVRTHIEDGRYFLLTSEEKFDLITGEPPPPKASGVTSLYSREYFELMRSRLNPGGAATYWLPVNLLTATDVKSIVAAFRGAFPDCSLWTGGPSQWILLGFNGMPSPVSEAGFRRIWDVPGVKKELEAIGLPGPESVGALYVADGPRLDAWLGNSPPLVDVHPERLSPPSPNGDADRGAFATISDPEASRRDFGMAAGVSRLWPPTLREASLPGFALRDTIHRTSNPDGRTLAACMNDPRLAEFVLWAFGSDRYAQALLAEARATGLSPEAGGPPVWIHLAAAAAQHGDLVRAEWLLSETRRVVGPYGVPPLSGRSLESLDVVLADRIAGISAAGKWPNARAPRR